MRSRTSAPARRDREADRVHQPGLGAADRRPRGRRRAPRALRDLHAGARLADRRARRRSGHRASVHGQRGQRSSAPTAAATTRCAPPSRSYLQECQDRGVPRAHGRQGRPAVRRRRHRRPALRADEQIALAADERSCSPRSSGGLVFTNLIETDQVYGHRHDVAGFHRALQLDRRRVGDGSSCCGPTTSWSSPPTMAAT